MSDVSDLFQSYVPEPPKEKKRILGPIPIRLIVPNVITLVSLWLGLTAIRFAFEDRLETAIWCIVLAAVLDGLDGRAARFFKGTSRFGIELDSLADAVNFGVAPALVLYHAGLRSIGSVGWLASLLFAGAVVLRLARFNVMADDPHRPEWQKNFFTGMPAPACAGTAMLPLYIAQMFNTTPQFDGVAAALLSAVYVVGIAFLAVSKIPVYSGKTLGKKVSRKMVAPILLGSALCFALIISFKITSLAVLSIIFLLTIPLSAMRYRTLERQHEAEKSVATDSQ
ncbi:MAG: phosphatidylcholine/phosphatidylserine synthase [Methylobacteriaceae bacterium]|jgi:CDP-diacylglycerol--serine O-phosphatidyltransferase|nr:phosphatidylcholine/phosphatidylserine synthase [Methylobacteriaceae bacterium]